MANLIAKSKPIFDRWTAQGGTGKRLAYEIYTLLLMQQACTKDHVEAFKRIKYIINQQPEVLELRLREGKILEEFTLSKNPIVDVVRILTDKKLKVPFKEEPLNFLRRRTQTKGKL
jgi:hypothetical protein